MEKYIKIKIDTRKEIVKDTDDYIKTNNNNDYYFYDLQFMSPLY